MGKGSVKKTINKKKVVAATTQKTKKNVKGKLNGAGVDVVHKDADTPILSRGQRKRAAKRNKFKQRDAMIKASLNLQPQAQKSLLDVNALQHAIDTVTIPTSERNGGKNNTNMNKQFLIKSNKARSKVQMMECEHVNLVREHPAFVQNPFETIQLHLKNTLAAHAAMNGVSNTENSVKKKKKTRRR